MRRVLVVSGLLLGSIVSPAGAAVPDAPAARPFAGPRLLADFNNDGAGDLAVGVPWESVGSVGRAGAVNVLYGSVAGGLTGAGSQLFSQDSPGVGSTAEEGDAFGRALASGDFNADGFTDLAVGAPGETVGSVFAAGAVNVLFGSAGGLTAVGSQLFTEANVGVGRTARTVEAFGGALAAADFDADGAADLATGVTAAVVSGVRQAGAVVIQYGSAGGLGDTGSQFFHQNTPGVGSSVEDSDHFGEALAVGDFNNSGTEDLAVGVPFEDVGSVLNAGAVNVLYGRPASGLTGTSSQLFTQDTPGVGSTAERFDWFGWRLAGGDFDADAIDDLAVGAPSGEGVCAIQPAGAVNVLYGSTNRLSGTGSQLFTQNSPGVGSTAEAGDCFGWTLAVGDFNNSGTEDLAVGVPFEDVGAIRDAGAVNVLYGRPATGLTGISSQLFTQDTPDVDDNVEAVDQFGQALAGGDFNADSADDLAVGVPDEALGALDVAGEVHVLHGSTSRLSGISSQLFTQDTPGVDDTVEAGDAFGFALDAARSE